MLSPNLSKTSSNLPIGGPRLATAQAWVLTPDGLMPIAESIMQNSSSKLGEEQLKGSRYIMAIFEPEDIKTVEAVRAKLDLEQKRWHDSQIEMASYQGEKLDIDHYFEKYRQNAEMLVHPDAPAQLLDPKILERYMALYEQLPENLRTVAKKCGIITIFDSAKHLTRGAALLTDSSRNIMAIAPQAINWGNSDDALVGIGGSSYLQDKSSIKYGLQDLVKPKLIDRSPLLKDIYTKAEKQSRNLPDTPEFRGWMSNGLQITQSSAESSYESIPLLYLMTKGEFEMVGLSQSLPYVYLAQQYLAQEIDAYADEILKRQPAQLTKPPFGFRINVTKLTEPQQTYFNRLNAILRLLEVTPDEFDTIFKHKLADQTLNHGLALLQGILNPEKFRQHPDSFSLPEIRGKYDPNHHFRQKKTLAINSASDSVAVNRQNMLKASRDIAAEVTSGFINNAVNILGYCGIQIAPQAMDFMKGPVSSAEAKQLDDSIREKLKFSDVRPDNMNALQRFASGEIPMHVLAVTPGIQLFAGGRIIPKSCGEMIHKALAVTIAQLSIQKNVSIQTKGGVSALFEKMNDLLPDIMVSQDTIDREKEIADIRKKYAKSGERQAYQFNEAQTVAAQLQKADVNALYEREIKPLAKALSIKVKYKKEDMYVDAHKALGDVLFSDPILKLAVAYATDNIADIYALMKDSAAIAAIDHAQKQVAAFKDITRESIAPTLQWSNHQEALTVWGKCNMLQACLGMDLQAKLAPRRYPPPKPSATGSNSLITEITRIYGALDARYDQHQLLHEALSSVGISAVLHAARTQAASLPLEKHKESLEKVRDRVGHVLGLKRGDVAEVYRKSNQQLKEVLRVSPVFMAMLVGEEALIAKTERESSALDSPAAVRNYVANTILPKLGMADEPPAPAEPRPSRHVIKHARDEAAKTEIRRRDTVRAISLAAAAAAAKAVEDAASAARAAADKARHEAAAERKRQEDERTRAAQAAEDERRAQKTKNEQAAQAQAAREKAEAEAQRALKERQAKIPLPSAREKAFAATAAALADETTKAACIALEQSCDHFRCDLPPNGAVPRIRLSFKGDDTAHSQDFNLVDPAIREGYASLGILPTPEEALDLKALVNGILASDFKPIVNKTPKNGARVEKNDPLPFLAIDPEKRQITCAVGKNGMWEAKIVSCYGDETKPTTVIISLGVHGDNPQAESLTKDRMSMIEALLERYNPRRKEHFKGIPTKGEVEAYVQNQTDALRALDPKDAAGTWEYAKNIELFCPSADVVGAYNATRKEAGMPELNIPDIVMLDDAWRAAWEKNKIGEVNRLGEPANANLSRSFTILPEFDPRTWQLKKNPQPTIIGSPRLERDGSNHTWHLAFTVKVSDKEVRDRTVNLCIDDPEIAVKRANEVLYGNEERPGFVLMLMDYFKQHPTARWAESSSMNSTTGLVSDLNEDIKGKLTEADIAAYHAMLKEHLKPGNRLLLRRKDSDGGIVTLTVHIRQQRGTAFEDAGSMTFSLTPPFIPGDAGKNLTAKKAFKRNVETVESFLRGDMDRAKLDMLIRDRTPRFERDLTVRIEEQTEQNGRIPLIFSVMRGAQDKKQEQQLDSTGMPIQLSGVSLPANDPNHDKYVADLQATVQKHVQALADNYYTDRHIAALPDHWRDMDYETLHEALSPNNITAKVSYKPYPSFNADLPKEWLVYAVNTNLHLFPSTEKSGAMTGDAAANDNPDMRPGVRQRMPSWKNLADHNTVEPLAMRMRNKIKMHPIR